MGYAINTTNGDILVTIEDGTVNNDTSITLIGRNYTGYGEFFNENFVKLLENSANYPYNPETQRPWINEENALQYVNSRQVYYVLPVEPILNTVGIMEFKLAFTSSERIDIKTSDDIIVQDFYELVEDQRTTTINLNLPSIQEALEYLVTIGILTVERKDTILAL